MKCKTLSTLSMVLLGFVTQPSKSNVNYILNDAQFQFIVWWSRIFGQFL